jgi:hypothetical protein
LRFVERSDRCGFDHWRGAFLREKN